LLGDRMTAADILWGVAFSWTMMFGLVPKGRVRSLRRAHHTASGIPADQRRRR
jgi:hypothetical protein